MHAPISTHVKLRGWSRSDSGSTAQEYAVVVALVALVIVVAVSAFGDAVADLFARIVSQLPFGG